MKKSTFICVFYDKEICLGNPSLHLQCSENLNFVFDRYHGIYDLDIWSGHNSLCLWKCSDSLGGEHYKISSKCQQPTNHQFGN